MRLWTSHHTFDHPWETVVKAACRKYPNPLNPSVLGTDVIDRKVEQGVLYSHRLVTTEWRFPTWILPFFGHRGPYYASEWSEVNPESKEMVVRTVNISLGKHVSVGEVVTYSEHPENPETTLLTQQAVISITGVPLIDHLERLLTHTIEQNANKVVRRYSYRSKSCATKYPDVSPPPSAAIIPRFSLWRIFARVSECFHASRTKHARTIRAKYRFGDGGPVSTFRSSNFQRSGIPNGSLLFSPV
ncbi:PRELI domain containing slowmo isoform X1 [Osmia lignaria lignaria]|uniref:PRELI domain containing slowmo isoform X1 n=1 Tax=Osmia lignaria lignaria TaxID=1437193 RepID=UPI001478EAF4|nr:PRELI domain containing protein 3A isoform X1 [Osmia lignaria]